MKADVVLIETRKTNGYGSWTATVRRVRDGQTFTEWSTFELSAVRRAFAAARSAQPDSV